MVVSIRQGIFIIHFNILRVILHKEMTRFTEQMGMFVNVVHSVLNDFAFAAELEVDTNASQMCTWARAYVHRIIFIILSGFQSIQNVFANTWQALNQFNIVNSSTSKSSQGVGLPPT